MLIDTLLLRLAAVIDPRTHLTGQAFRDSTSAIVISSLSGTTPVVVTTATSHGLVSGQEVYIKDNAGTPLINNTLANPTHVVTVTGVSTFTVPVTFVSNTGAKGTATPAMIGAARGQKYEGYQILGIYNSARRTAFSVLLIKFGSDQALFKKEVGDFIASATVTFSGASPATGPKPAGYQRFISLNDSTGMIPLVGPDKLERILAGSPNWAQSATNRHVFEQGSSLIHTSTFVSGSTTLRYIGLTDFTLTQVLGGATSEVFSDGKIEGILQIAVKISAGLGGEDLVAYARDIYGVK